MLSNPEVYALCEKHFQFLPESPVGAWEVLAGANYHGIIHHLPDDRLRQVLNSLCLQVIRDSIGEGRIEEGAFFHGKLEEDVTANDIGSGKYLPPSEVAERADPHWRWYDEFFWGVDHLIDTITARKKLRRQRSEQPPARHDANAN